MPTKDLRNREEPGTGHDVFRDKRLDPPLDRIPRQAQRPSDRLVRGERIASEMREDLEVLLVDHGSRRFIKRAILKIACPDARCTSGALTVPKTDAEKSARTRAQTTSRDPSWVDALPGPEPDAGDGGE